MIAATWSCGCGATGTGLPPRQCTSCWDSLVDDKDTIVGILSLYEGITDRISGICRVLGYDDEHIDFEGTRFDEPDTATFEVSWEQAACGRGCCGYETITKKIPLRYLWDADWADQHKAAQEAERKAKEEADRQKKIREAQKQVLLAEAKKASARQDAERALAKAQHTLAKIEASP